MAKPPSVKNIREQVGKIDGFIGQLNHVVNKDRDETNKDLRTLKKQNKTMA